MLAQPAMRVLIFEPQFLGHNLVHVARLVRAVDDLGCQPVLATTPMAIKSEEFRLHVTDVLSRLELVTLGGFRTDAEGRRIRSNGIRGAAALYGGLHSAIKQAKPDHVYVPLGNQLARLAALPFGLTSTLRKLNAEAETLLVGGRYLYPRSSVWHRFRQKALLSLIAAGPWSSVFHLDDAAYEQFQLHGGRMAQIGKLLPEPIGQFDRISKTVARKRFDLPIEGRAIGVVGLIECRKGLDLLLNAIRAASGQLQPTDRLFLIGPHHPEVHRMLAGEHADLVAADRVRSIDRRLSEAEMAAAIAAIDVVATVYPNHPYASGVLSAAAAVGRPLIGSSTGWIGRTINRFRLGHTCDPGSPPDVASKLVAALDASSHYEPSAACERLVEFLGDRNYAALWTARLRERLGVGPSPEARTWDWACGIHEKQELAPAA